MKKNRNIKEKTCKYSFFEVFGLILLTSRNKLCIFHPFDLSFKIVVEDLLMPKQKTHKGLSKRVKVTASGKVMHKRSGSGHLMSSKNAKRRRKIAGSKTMTKAMAKTAKIMICD